MPEWTISFVQFNQTMTMTVVAPDGTLVGRIPTPDAETAGRVLADIFETKQSFKLAPGLWET